MSERESAPKDRSVTIAVIGAVGLVLAAIVGGVFTLLASDGQGEVAATPTERQDDSRSESSGEPSGASSDEAAPSDGVDPEPSPTPSEPSIGVTRTRLELPKDTSWDIDNWEESDDFDTWDFVLGFEAVKFHEWAEAQSEWNLDDCEDPDFRVWSESVRWVDVDSEHLVFCLRTTTGATAMLRILEMSNWDQEVRSYVVEVTRRA